MLSSVATLGVLLDRGAAPSSAKRAVECKGEAVSIGDLLAWWVPIPRVLSHHGVQVILTGYA